MKKVSPKHKKPSKVRGNSFLFTSIVLIVALVVGVIFILKAQERAVYESQATVLPEASRLHFSPEEGCVLSDLHYVCNIGIRNTSAEDISWVGFIGDIEGAELSNDGYGIIQSGESGFVEFLIPVAFCQENPDGKGDVTIVDKKKSTNQGRVTFRCTP